MQKYFRSFVTFAALAGLGFAGCAKDGQRGATTRPISLKPVPVVQMSVGDQKRFGDEIVVCGHLYRIGAPVVTWLDAGGYDAYSSRRRFVPYERASFEATMKEYDAKYPDPDERGQHVNSPDRLGQRYAGPAFVRATTRAATQAASTAPADVAAYLATKYPDPTTRPLLGDDFDRARHDDWTIEALREKVDQFVLHYDVCGVSKYCFQILQDDRGLSVHFMLDIDGTIYQTADLRERTYHASQANDRSIGIEIANIGSYGGSESPAPLQQWYKKDAAGQTYISVPARFGGENATRVPGVYRPSRNEPVVGSIRGQVQRMYDLTPQQYDSLIKLTAALGDVFPQIKLDYPRGPDGTLLARTLTPFEFDHYKGVMGHYHVQSNKSDPGPAIRWDYLLDNARHLLAQRKPMIAKGDR